MGTNTEAKSNGGHHHDVLPAANSNVFTALTPAITTDEPDTSDLCIQDGETPPNDGTEGEAENAILTILTPADEPNTNESAEPMSAQGEQISETPVNATDAGSNHVYDEIQIRGGSLLFPHSSDLKNYLATLSRMKRSKGDDEHPLTVSHRVLSMPKFVMDAEEMCGYAVPSDGTPLALPKSSDLEKSTQSVFSTDSQIKQSEEDLHVYSKVKRMPPTMPPKSSDLENYLDTLSGFNEGVYSEPFRVSDFTNDDTQVSEAAKKESDPSICAPIYPIPLTPPQGTQSPVEVTADSIKEVKELGIGQFGQVILATTSGLSLKNVHDPSKIGENQDKPIFLAVKRLKPHPSQTEQEAFNKETNFMSKVTHPNVFRFFGVCYQNPNFIVMEYTTEGDLYHFLQRYTDIVSLTTPSNSTQISTSTIVYMASQIASAMQYLAQQKFVHRDLATRNCLVGENFTIKVADLGVNLDLYQSHYYKIRGNRLLPIRWMATECFDGKFSEKSDIWAFGITLWELFTLSKDKPYPNLSDEDVIKNALMRQDRQFPSRPAACPPAVYEIMQQCWIVNLQQRATFQELNVMLQTAAEAPNL